MTDDKRPEIIRPQMPKEGAQFSRASAMDVAQLVVPLVAPLVPAVYEAVKEKFQGNNPPPAQDVQATPSQE